MSFNASFMLFKYFYWGQSWQSIKRAVHEQPLRQKAEREYKTLRIF